MTEQKVRILFDGYWWVSGPPSNRHVMRETVAEWLRQFPEDEVAIVVRRRDVAAARSELPGRVTVFGTPLWPHGVSNATVLALAARRWRAEVVYAQNFAPVVPGVFTVGFVHDVMWATNPEWFTRTELVYFTPMGALAKRAGLVLTSSRSEAERIRATLGVSRVEPVGIGMSTELMAVDPTPLDRPPVPGRFLLAVGRLNIRKNLSAVITAALRSGVVSPGFPLLVVGGADGKGEELSSEVSAAIDAGTVRFTGHVSDAELVWLYRHCALFVFLSRGEGYGMPAVEALYFGAPALVSDIDVFEEIVPAGVPRVGPDDIEAAATAMRDIVSGRRTASVALADPPTWSGSVSRMRTAILQHRSVRSARQERS